MCTDRSFVLTPLVLAALLVLSSCSSNDSTVLARQAGAQSWHLQTGASASNEAFQGLNYYPSSTLTIDAGDTVTWAFPSNEPHTVSLPANGGTLPPPNSPTVQQPAGGATFDGSAFTSSGFMLGGGSYALQFTKPGTYKVYCLIHQPEMVQTVVVQPAGAAYPHDQAFYDAAGAAAIATDLQAATASTALFPYAAGANHFAVGISPGLNTSPPGNPTVLRFLSSSDVTTQSVTIAVGTTVTWTNLSNNEPHTVTLAPVGVAFPTLNPFAPPSGGTSYDGSTLVNSGPLFPGSSFALTFTKAGTYSVHCLFHDDTEHMITTVVVI